MTGGTARPSAAGGGRTPCLWIGVAKTTGRSGGGSAAVDVGVVVYKVKSEFVGFGWFRFHGDDDVILVAMVREMLRHGVGS